MRLRRDNLNPLQASGNFPAERLISVAVRYPILFHFIEFFILESLFCFNFHGKASSGSFHSCSLIIIKYAWHGVPVRRSAGFGSEIVSNSFAVFIFLFVRGSCFSLTSPTLCRGNNFFAHASTWSHVSQSFISPFPAHASAFSSHYHPHNNF